MKLTKRMKKLKDRLFEVEYNDPGTWHFKEVNILEEHPELTEEPLVVRKAYAQYYIGKNLPVTIKEDELIVGNPNQNSVAWGTVMPLYFTKEEGEHAETYELNESSIWGHHPPQYDKVIKKGITGIIAEINAEIVSEMRCAKPNPKKLNEWRAMIIALDGVVEFARRYAQEALKLSLCCKDIVRKRELFEIYNTCRHVPQNPAHNFNEALQSFWFIYCMVNSAGEYVPFGRADQYFYPYYKKDMDRKAISKEHGADLMASFLVKCNERIIMDTKKAENHATFGMFSQGRIPELTEKKAQTGGYEQRQWTWKENEDINSDSNYNYGQSGNDWLMNCIVAGVNENGNDATNEVSYLFVDLMASMRLLMPTLAARVHKDSPESFLELLANTLRYGQGEPMIYNDDAIIPGFVHMGVPLEDARNYSNDGCWECLVAGKSHFSYAHIMNLQLIEFILFQGKSLKSGNKEAPDTGAPHIFKDYNAFYAAYLKQMKKAIDFQCERRIKNFGLSHMIAPDPLFSSIVDNCIEKGRDISQDGAKYIFHMLIITGLSNTVDSLAVIKKLVFEDKVVSMEELIQAVKDDWKGHERLCARVMNLVPKFGNDDDYVDAIAMTLMEDFEDMVDDWNRKQEKLLFCSGIGTFENYAVLGRDTWATPDGRGAGEALAPNFSPTAGMDISGPTSVIKSVTKPNLLRYFSGCPVDISVNSNEFEGGAGVERMVNLIKSFCNLDGQIMTITSTNVADLRDAQVNPHLHRDLRVRMGGLSAYFIAMAPAQQENIIKRFSR